MMKRLFKILAVTLLLSLPLLAKTLSHNSMKHIAMKMLKRQGVDFNLPFDDGVKPIHKVFGYYNISGSKDETLLIIQTHPSEGNDCHACGVAFSFFHFKADKLLKSSIDSLILGEYGKAPKKNELKLKRLKGDVLALFYKSFSLAQGYEGDFLNIYDIGNPKAVHMLLLRLSMNNEPSGATPIEKWSSIYTIDKESNIIQKISGTKDGKSFSKEVIYQLDGDKYHKTEG